MVCDWNVLDSWGEFIYLVDICFGITCLVFELLELHVFSMMENECYQYCGVDVVVSDFMRSSAERESDL